MGGGGGGGKGVGRVGGGEGCGKGRRNKDEQLLNLDIAVSNSRVFISQISFRLCPGITAHVC